MVQPPPTPIAAGRARHEHRQEQQQEGRRQQPERDVVHAREGHVRRADHDRHHPVGEAADQRRHDHEEDHDQAVRGGEDVVHVLAGVERGIAFEAVDHRGQAVEDLDARLLQLHAHDDRQDAADDAREDREDQVERADVLVVGRIDPAHPAVIRLVVVVVVSCSACHVPLRSLFSMPSAASVRRATRPCRCRRLPPSAPCWRRRGRSWRQPARSCTGLRDTTRMAIGMKAWSLPQSSEHWP